MAEVVSNLDPRRVSMTSTSQPALPFTIVVTVGHAQAGRRQLSVGVCPKCSSSPAVVFLAEPEEPSRHSLLPHSSSRVQGPQLEKNVAHGETSKSNISATSCLQLLSDKYC
jgi:hypothetical protein